MKDEELLEFMRKQPVEKLENDFPFLTAAIKVLAEKKAQAKG
ncbi:MAG: hypothetical protein V1494_00575 [Candidatus Diapherotrites archaeon]